jgi:predicted CxxxxCH...CXXCH cytochrome family protein
MSSLILKAGVVLSSAILVLALGCSDARTPKSLINPDTGKHDAGWESPDSHGAVAKAAATSTSGFAACQECHADTFNGGISNITCLNTAGCHGASVSAPHSPKPWRGGTRTHTNTDQSNGPACALCHTNGANSSLQPSPFDSAAAPGCFNNTLCHGAVGHSAGWADPDSHGAAAKSAPTSTTGFSYCQMCHGNDFTGSVSQQTCLNTAGCHGAGVYAPHSPKPWRSSTRTHTNTDQNNAPVCALCHTNGANSSVQPSPFDSGAAAGCFNNTLCHGAEGHAAGWADPGSHGASAKSAPGTTSGFSYCQTCHGSDFTGGTALQTCLNTTGCHGAGVNAPHAASWLPGDTYTHSTTDEGNASVCGLCHLGNRQPPSYVALTQTVGCFDNTLCHGVVGHPAGWSDPGNHGTTAKSAPSSSAGFSYCQTCHGSDFTGGTALQSCFTCHQAGTTGTPPHAFPWLPGDTYTHTTTNQGNAPVCGLCHLSGRTPPSYATVPAGTTPNCFDNTLCHGDVGAPHVVPYTDPALHGPDAKADLTYCQACHSDQPSGGPGSNPRFNVAKGSLATGCEGASCHASYMAHPTPWRGFVANDTGHMTAGNMTNACVLCHGATLGGGTGPACTSCHTLGSPLSMTNCTSCHGNPPNGSAYPNAAGKHSQHIALGSYIVCDTCHNGGGTGTTNHDNGNTTAFVAFLSSYNAKSGAASYNATNNTCANVSCHGGQTTPGWLSSTVIDVNTQCTSCHASGTAQYNSYNSGHHSTHVSQGIACYTCHDITLLAVNHFTSLNTTALEGPASATLRSQLQYNGTSCNPSAGGLSGCHSSHNW